MLRTALMAALLAATTLAGPSAALAQGNAGGGTAAAPSGGGSPTIAAIRSRGELVCGVITNVAGFALPDSRGVMRGLDADGCRAVAAAIFGDANKLRFVPTTTVNRFTALQSGEVDLLVRDTTWTLKREADLGLLFAGINYYDGTGFLVKKSSGVKSAKDLDGATVCVQPGTSTELAVNDYFRTNKMKFTPILIQDLPELEKAFIAGRCDVYSTDSSRLATFGVTQGDKDAYVLLPEIISKEPLGPAVRKGDDKFFDLVRWTFFALLIAEEKGITQENVANQVKTATDPEARRLLGVEGDIGKSLGVSNEFAVSAIKAVGNYGEIWQRSFGVLGVQRGLNNLWNKGGLQYAPPMR
jgi:general L-amino acid transport system substrate-binding protein